MKCHANVQIIQQLDIHTAQIHLEGWIFAQILEKELNPILYSDNSLHSGGKIVFDSIFDVLEFLKENFI